MAISLGDGADGRQFETRDIRLAAALMAVGIRPLGAEAVRVVTRADRPGEAKQFQFAQKSEDGAYETAELVAAWRQGLPWIAAHPDHPFAYAMAAQMNHRDLMDLVKSAVPQVVLQRGKSVAMLPLNASSLLEEQILGRLER